MVASKFEITFKQAPLGFTVEALPLDGQKGAIVTSVSDRKLRSRLKSQSKLIAVEGTNVEKMTQPEIVGLIRSKIQGEDAKWPLKITFRAPRQVKAKKKRKQRSRRNTPKSSPELTPQEGKHVPRFPLYVMDSRVEGLGSGAYEGKWYKGTVTAVKFHKNRNAYSYRIQYDRMPHKSYPISEARLRPLAFAPFDPKKALNAIEFVPGLDRHATRKTVMVAERS